MERYTTTALYTKFALMTVVWGIVGMLVGVIIARNWYGRNLTFTSTWKARPPASAAHQRCDSRSAVALFATSLRHVVQRTSHTPLFAPKLAEFTFWGWQLIIVLAGNRLSAGDDQR